MTRLKTRKPTGLAPWPMILLAGVEKSGKSYACAAFSSSDLIDRTLYIEIGEGAADQYGAIPGARYEIVEHDGSYVGILEAVQAAVAEPAPGKPHAIVLDSATELWGLLCDEQQTIASKRGKGVITMDQWNAAKKRWRKLIDALRAHKGPVIFTARYEQVTVMRDGKPTAEKEWKVRAEKDLAFEVDGIITMTEPRRPFVAGMRTVAFDMPAGGFAPKNPDSFDLDTFFRKLNIDGGGRTHVPRKEDPDAYGAIPEDAIGDDELPPAPTPAQPDGWTDVPDAPTPDTDAIDDGKRVRGRMFALLSERGIDDADEQRRGMSNILGRTIASRTELTVDDMRAIIRSLEAPTEPVQDELDAAQDGA